MAALTAIGVVARTIGPRLLTWVGKESALTALRSSSTAMLRGVRFSPASAIRTVRDMTRLEQAALAFTVIDTGMILKELLTEAGMSPNVSTTRADSVTTSGAALFLARQATRLMAGEDGEKVLDEADDYLEAMYDQDADAPAIILAVLHLCISPHMDMLSERGYYAQVPSSAVYDDLELEKVDGKNEPDVLSAFERILFALVLQAVFENLDDERPLPTANQRVLRQLNAQRFATGGEAVARAMQAVTSVMPASQSAAVIQLVEAVAQERM